MAQNLLKNLSGYAEYILNVIVRKSVVSARFSIALNILLDKCTNV